jgi:DNA-binding NtrC family response regulator
VRELENAIERATVLSRSSQITEDALPREVREATVGDMSGTTLTFAVGTPIADIEMQMIRETLRKTRGDKRLTAKLLGIATRTIYRRLEGGTDDGSDAECATDGLDGGDDNAFVGAVTDQHESQRTEPTDNSVATIERK